MAQSSRLTTAERLRRRAEEDVADGVVDAVAIGTSVGGLEALMTILAVLPADFPAAILVVQHRPDDYHGMLAEILGRHTPLRVYEAKEGETLRNGTVFRYLISAPRGPGLGLGVFCVHWFVPRS